jgi:DNA-binding GntR family transcriptional regulator
MPGEDIDRDASVPPYRQLAEILREQIRSGELPPGGTIPPIRRLRDEYGVAEITARKAVALLRAEGLAETVNGWGSFVVRELPKDFKRAPRRR